MTFSVIIPCYNCVKTLEATVNSIRACGLTDYEILLIDDGSADGTAKLCKIGHKSVQDQYLTFRKICDIINARRKNAQVYI